MSSQSAPSGPWFPTLLATGVLLALVVITLAAQPAQATGTPSPTPPGLTHCAPQGEIATQPITDPTRMCPHYLVRESPISALPGITSIAYAPVCAENAPSPDWCGRLFFVRPAAGEVAWVGSFEPETGAYSVHTFADRLDTPNGLVWHDGRLYVTGGPRLYRLDDQDGDGCADSTVVLVDSLPEGPGAWAGSVAIGPDNRLYVSVGASCDVCEEADLRRTALVSYALDGTDERIEARGLRAAYDFAWHPATGDLYAVDSERDGRGPLEPLDEINLIETGRHYGWPYCYESAAGVISDSVLPTPPGFCDAATRPLFTLPAHSAPAGMAFYTGDAFPEYRDDLLIVLGGETDGRLPQGYALYRVCLDPAGKPESCRDLAGNAIQDASGTPLTAVVILPVDSYYNYGLEILTLQGQGFYPEHPVDIAISPDGLIAISIAEGRIIELLPVWPAENQP